MLATFAQKRNFMMTCEEILSIEEYCAEHKVSHRKRLEELDIPFWHFYKAKKKYRKEDEQDSHPGEFIQLSSGRFVPQVMPPSRTPGKSIKPCKPVEEKNGSSLAMVSIRPSTTVYSLEDNMRACTNGCFVELEFPF